MATRPRTGTVTWVSTTLFVAAGGGGDAITASVLGPALGLADEPVVMTYAWDRLIIDPLPGPRSAEDFTGLHELAPDVLEILPTTEPIAPAGSSLPRLAAELPGRLLLLDPSRGAAGMTKQVNACADYFAADEIVLVDVGGDGLTTGKDEGLRSPLADLLSIAACAGTGRPSRIFVPAPGIDAELAEQVLLSRIEHLGGRDLALLDAATFKSVRDLFTWHPSEASGLLAVASEGTRGRVEVRDAGTQISLTDRTPTVYSVDADQLAYSGPAAALKPTTSLAEAEEAATRVTGLAEIAYERRKADGLQNQRSHFVDCNDLLQVDSFADEAAARRADFISIRRLAELMGVRAQPHLTSFRALLAENRPTRYNPPIYKT